MMRINTRRLDSSFKRFVARQDDYTPDEKEQITTCFQETHIRRIFLTSIILLLWSLLGVVLDSVFFGGGIVALFMSKQGILVFLPALIYFFGNLTLKILFIKWYLGSIISWRKALMSALPYIGSGLLLTLLGKYPAFSKALGRYLKYLRGRGGFYISRLFLGKRKSGVTT